MKYLSILRPVNLLIVAVTMLMMRFLLISPAAAKFGLQLTLTNWEFCVLILSCVLIAAGGYVVNDLYDVAADDVNKPGVNLIGRVISTSHGWWLYAWTSGLGLLAGLFSSLAAGDIKLISIQIVAAVSLYLYAASLKRITLLGNVLVAIIVALSVVTPAVFEPSVYALDRPADWYAAGFIWTWVLIMTLFSFLLTLVREIVKDIEDQEGDKLREDATIAIVWGTEAARGVAIAMLTTTLGLVIWGAILMQGLPYVNGWGLIAYAAGVALLLVVDSIILLRAGNKKQFHRASTMLKVTMVAGLLFLVFFNINIF